MIPGVVNFWVAGVSHETRGYVENTAAGLPCCPAAERFGPAKDRKGVRAKLDFTDILGAEVLLTYERVTSDQLGDANQELIIEPIYADYQRQYDPRFDEAAIPHNELTSDDIADVARIDVQTFGGRVKRDFGEWEATVIAQYANLDYFQNNSNPSPGPELEGLAADSNPQWTVEARAQSPDFTGLFGIEPAGFSLGQSDFQAGIFYQRRELNVNSNTLRHSAGFINTLIAGGGLPFPPFAPPALTDIRNFDDGRIVVFDQTVTSIAGFAHFAWHVTDPTTLEFGMRLTEGNKGRVLGSERGSGALAPLSGVDRGRPVHP